MYRTQRVHNDSLLASTLLLGLKLLQLDLSLRLPTAPFRLRLSLANLLQIMHRPIPQRNAQFILFTHLDLLNLSRLFSPYSLRITDVRLVPVVPVNIFMVLPSALRGVDRMAKVVFTILVGLDVGPFKFGCASSCSWRQVMR